LTVVREVVSGSRITGRLRSALALLNVSRTNPPSLTELGRPDTDDAVIEATARSDSVSADDDVRCCGCCGCCCCCCCCCGCCCCCNGGFGVIGRGTCFGGNLVTFRRLAAAVLAASTAKATAAAALNGVVVSLL